MKTVFRAWPLACLFLAAAGCGSEQASDEAAVSNEQNSAGNEFATNESAQAPAEMPPMIVRSPAYRCDDGKALYVNVLTDENAVTVRDSRADAPTLLTREAAEQAFTGSGRSLSSTGDVVRYGAPERPEQECRVAQM